MTKGEKIIVGVLSFVAIMAIIIVISIFRSNKPNDSGYKEAIKAKDELIDYVQKEREQDRQDFNYQIQQLLQIDSTNKIKDKKATIRYEKVPTDIRNLSHEDLRRAIWEY